MISQDKSHNAWVEKYRPPKIEECIIPPRLKKILKKYLKEPQLQSMIFTGEPGTGKTTVAKALCEQMKVDYIVINGSDEGRQIDTLRNIIIPFASTCSFTGAKKVIIVDEADGIPPLVQEALRAVMESVCSNCTFILTCNHIGKIKKALYSRSPPIDFNLTNEEKPELAMAFFNRLKEILDKEKIKYDEEIVSKCIVNNFPDFRKTINIVQRYCIDGELDISVLTKGLDDEIFRQLVSDLSKKNFIEVRKWAGENSDIENYVIIRKLYDNCVEYLDQNSIPKMCMILGEYLDKSTRTPDPEITMMMCFTEIMATCSFK